MEFKKKGLLVFIFLLLIVNVSASDYFISNSEDWKDVYSVVHYANLQNAKSSFLVSTAHGNILLSEVPKGNDLKIITSKNNPFVFNYKAMADSKGFNSVTETEVDNANLELIKELPDITNFVVVGTSYGYSAIAVSPYSVISNSWVFLADRTNIAEIDSILSSRNIDKVLIYGYVDREVRDTLEKYNPESINTEDRFKDNIEIVKKYLEIKPVEQVVLSNGEFIEHELMSGMEPVLFTGRENVPDQIRDYLKNSPIKVGVLVGNELIGAATNIRRSAGISVMVKFARGARGQKTGVAAVEGLDLFYLPSPSLALEIHSVKYNKANSQLEITYKSNSNIPAYLKGTITLISENNQQKVGDMDPIFIAPGSFKTISYPGVQVTGEKLSAEVYTLYGEIPTSLDRVLQGTFNTSIISVIDNCDLNVDYVKYNKQTKLIYVKTVNPTAVDCYVDLELVDIIINNVKQTIGTEGSEILKAGQTKKITINQRLDDADIEDNPFVNLMAYHGEKQDSLVKLFKGRFELKVSRFTVITYLIMALIIIVILLIIFIIILKRRDEDY